MRNKDYELIAEVIYQSDLDDRDAVKLARSFSDALRDDNPRISPDKFMDVALGEDWRDNTEGT